MNAKIKKEGIKTKKYHVAIYYTGSCDFVIAEARRFTEEEKAKYVEEFRERGFAVCGEHLRLEGLHWADCPSRRTDGEVVGSSNFTWIITDEEKAKYIELNRKKLEQERKKDIDEQIKYWQGIIAKAEAQNCMPTKEQKKAQEVLRKSHFRWARRSDPFCRRSSRCRDRKSVV